MSKEKACPDCGREFKHQGALNLHRSVHCKKARKTRECEHEWSLLIPSNHTHARAIQQGKESYCTKCYEVE